MKRRGRALEEKQHWMRERQSVPESIPVGSVHGSGLVLKEPPYGALVKPPEGRASHRDGKRDYVPIRILESVACSPVIRALVTEPGPGRQTLRLREHLRLMGRKHP